MTTTCDTPPVTRDHVVSRFTGAVLDAFDRLGGAPAWSMSTPEQRQTLVELDRLRSRLDELRLRVLSAGDKAGIGEDSGASSTAAWLAHATHRDRAGVSADVRLAAALDGRFETTRRALAAGDLSVQHARVIVAAVDDLPADVDPTWRDLAEAHLVSQAALVDPKTLRILGRRIFEVLDPETADEREGKKLEEEERRARTRTSLSMRDNGDGTHSGTFKLPDLHAAILKKAVQALAAPRRTGQARLDPETGRKRSYPELLGAAFCELLERYPTDKLPATGGTNATIVVTIGYQLLAAGIGAAVLDDGTRISATEARRLACEAGIIPMVLGGDSMPLDVGRERRLHDRYQRLAMAHRDEGCSAESCDRPPAWAEAHHDWPWSSGGPTDVAHGKLYCGHHHHLVHDDRYLKTRLGNGKTRFTRRQ
ncbi:MAG TPA: DUF222 domain-containing protein [Nocardioidaceae bacterium]|nr:DUF222 domain-containing protein [Nocardioidaceae bacterium]